MVEMSSNQDRRPSQDDSVSEDVMAFLMQAPSSHGAIPKIRSHRQEDYEGTKSTKDKGTLQKNGQQVTREEEEVFVHRDRPRSERNHRGDVIVLRSSVDGQSRPVGGEELRKHSGRREDRLPPPGQTDFIVMPIAQPERKQDTDASKPGQSRDLKDKKRNKQSAVHTSNKVDQENQAEKYEGLPLVGNEEGNQGGYSTSKPVSNKEKNIPDHKHKKVAGNTNGEQNKGPGKVMKSNNNISLIFPDEEGQKSVMRIVVRSFASSAKSQNCVDVKIEGEKFQAHNVKNEEIERLIRELTKYVIQIQKKLETDGDNLEKATSSKSKREPPRKCVEVVELFRRTRKSCGKAGRAENAPGKSGKEDNKGSTKTRVELGISLKIIPPGSNKESKPNSGLTPGPDKVESKEGGKEPNEDGAKYNDSAGGTDKPSESNLGSGTSEESNVGQDASKRGSKRHRGKRENNGDSRGKDMNSRSNLEGKPLGDDGTRTKRKRPNVDGEDATPENISENDTSEKPDAVCRKKCSPKQTRSANNSGHVPKPTTDGTQDPNPPEKKVCSVASVKDNVSKMFVKLAASKTVIAEGLTAAIRQKFKSREAADEGKKRSRTRIGECLASLSKPFQIPVLFEEVEPELQSKSSVRIHLEHSTDEGNLRLNLVGIRNDNKQDFGGRIEFSQAYNTPKRKCEDIETMKEILANCVKKVENVLNNMSKDERKPTKKEKHEKKGREKVIEGPKTSSGRKKNNEMKDNSSDSGSGSSRLGERRISFKDDVTDILPFSGSINDGEMSEECSRGGTEGECDDCDEEDPSRSHQDVNDMLEAKLDAGEFDRQAIDCFKRERFSVSLKDPDAIERYKRNSQLKLSNDIFEDPSDQPDGVSDAQVEIDDIGNDNANEHNNNNTSKTNLAIPLSTDDNATTTVLGISMRPDGQAPTETDQSQSDISITKERPTKPVSFKRSVSIVPSQFPDKLPFGDESSTDLATTEVSPTDTDDVMLAESELPKTESNEEPVSLTPKSTTQDIKFPTVMVVSATTRPKLDDSPKDAEVLPKKKGCCQLL